jgi:hypothetical protein
MTVKRKTRQTKLKRAQTGVLAPQEEEELREMEQLLRDIKNEDVKNEDIKNEDDRLDKGGDKGSDRGSDGTKSPDGTRSPDAVKSPKSNSSKKTVCISSGWEDNEESDGDDGEKDKDGEGPEGSPVKLLKSSDSTVSFGEPDLSSNLGEASEELSKELSEPPAKYDWSDVRILTY